MLKELLLKLLLLIMLPFLILLLLVSLPFTAIQLKREKHKLGKLAGEFVCLECGEIMGMEAIRLADERWANVVKQKMAEKTYKLGMRMVRSVDAVCPHCGCIYLYREEDQSFVVRSEQSGGKEYQASNGESVS